MTRKDLQRLYSRLKNTFSTTDAIKQSLKLDRLRPKHHCLLCDSRTTRRICKACQEQFFISPRYHCSCCALPLSHSALFCGECLRTTPDFDRTFSPFLYQKPLSDLLIHFKENTDLFAGKALSDLFAKKIQDYYLQQHLPFPDLIVPVPLHWKKQWQRGFNHSIFLADNLSRALSIPVFKDSRRTQQAPEQKALKRTARLNNIKHSFTVTSSLDGEHVVIVDDVMTTGATVNALAKTLKQAGASYVSVWVVARTAKT
jgi:ComF family protein